MTYYIQLLNSLLTNQSHSKIIKITTIKMASEIRNNFSKDSNKSANSIPTKYNTLMSNKRMHQSLFEDLFKSISKPLNNLVKHTTKPQQNVYAKRMKFEEMRGNGDADTDGSNDLFMNYGDDIDATFHEDNDEEKGEEEEEEEDFKEDNLTKNYITTNYNYKNYKAT